MAVKICLTGGPSGGKTTMAMALTRAYSDRLVMIPEAASILFSGGFHRVNFERGVRCQQQAIYHVQIQHEAIFELEWPEKLLVCDRGTLDGHAYWPGDKNDFFATLKTSREAEIARYKWVIHLDTARAYGYNANHNPLRREAVEEANEINRAVTEAWANHPQRFIIPSTRSFAQKVTMTLQIVDRIFLGHTFSQICSEVLC